MRYNWGYQICLVLALLFVSCKTHKNTFVINRFDVNFSYGNIYPKICNVGSFNVSVQILDTVKSNIKSNQTFDAYSPLKNPVQILMSKSRTSVVLSSNKKSFILGDLDVRDSLCENACKLSILPSDKITFKSYINPLPYWHGFSGLGGLSLFMHYHHYILKIQKSTGESLLLNWKYSRYRFMPYGKKRKEWSGDYCEDNGGGLVRIKIRHKKFLHIYKIKKPEAN